MKIEISKRFKDFEESVLSSIESESYPTFDRSEVVCCLLHLHNGTVLFGQSYGNLKTPIAALQQMAKADAIEREFHRTSICYP